MALSKGLIYLARDGHYIAALEATNGQERWRFDTVGVVRGTPLVVGHDLLVSSGANTLFCLDALTGEEYWAFHSEDTLAQYWPTRGAPAVADNLVYVALGASTEFNALSLRTGRKVWEVNLHERMTGGPLLDIALGMVYVVTWSGKMLALDMHAGSTRWKIQLASGSQSSRPTGWTSSVRSLERCMPALWPCRCRHRAPPSASLPFFPYCGMAGRRSHLLLSHTVAG